jgi:hypothetical protein
MPFLVPSTPCRHQTQLQEAAFVVWLSVHVSSNVTMELSLCVSPHGQTQQMGLDNTSPTRSPWGQYRECPITLTPSPLRTTISGRAAAHNCPESANDGEKILSAFENSRCDPDPIYPHQVGIRHPEDPLPMIPRSLKKYYNIYNHNLLLLLWSYKANEYGWVTTL